MLPAEVSTFAAKHKVMHYTLLLFGMLFLVACRQNPALDAEGIVYPHTRQDSSVVDDYHGTAVADPYRWLEDDLSAETAEWVDAQNAVTQAHLAAIPFRQNIVERLERLYNFERVGTPEVVDDWLYYNKNDGLQNQSVLYREPIAGGTPEVVLDPNTFSDDNTTSLSSTSISRDGHYMAYQVSEGGSDWKMIKILDLNTHESLPEQLENVKFSGMSWLGEGFVYSRYPAAEGGSELSNKNENHQLYYHQLQTPQAEDVLLYEDAVHPQRNVFGSVSDDEQWVVVGTTASTSGNTVSIAPAAAFRQRGQDALQPVVRGFEHDYNFLFGNNENLYFWTNAEAPNGRVVVLDATAPEAGFADVIAEDAQRPLKSVTFSGDRIYARYLQDVSSRLEVYSLDGSLLHQVNLPGIGTASGVSAPSKGGPAFFSFSSFTTPSTVLRIQSDGSTQVWRNSDNGFDASLYETKQVRYRSKDGTEIPMFVIHRKGLQLDGQRPTLLYGYGGFDIAIEPQHAVMRLDLFSPILEQGGVCAVASLRGGSEFGSAWHEAGMREHKQNVFDDFIAAAEYLQSEGYTSPARTAIYGRSNGGLLVGACITQRPELYGVAFPAVGVLDMLRYHQFTIGWAWAGDYGRADSADAFKYLYAYSPLHNASPQEYPATLITTADHDDRVVPAHSFKFAAALQEAQLAPEPVLIRIDKSSGHGAGKPVAKQIEEAADLLSFMFYHMGIDYQAPTS